MKRPSAYALSVACALALLLCACRDEREHPTGGLDDLERLAFVAAGECRLIAGDGTAITCATREPLLVDRFEVDRGAFADWVRREDLAEEPLRDAQPTPEGDALPVWPASGLTLDEARAFAAARGMRLASASEWLRIAAGTRAQPWPWGGTRTSSVANTAELGLGRPVAVGTFEHGQSPEGVHDLVGNVWEWVEEPLAALAGDSRDLAPLAWAMGGAYTTRLRRLHEPAEGGRLVAWHVDLDARTRSRDVGVRCVADARTWLVARARGLGTGPAARARLAAIGARWGREAVPLLEELAGENGASPALSALLDGARR